MIKAIIFDFDGVIHDTYELNYKLNNLILDGISRSAHKSMFDGNVYSSPKVTSDLVLKFSEMQHSEFKDLIIDKHIKEQLLILADSFDLFIVSSNIEKTLNYYLQKNSLDNIFKEVLATESSRSKEKKLNMILEKHNLNVDECVFVTDTLGDILEANKVHMKSIAVDFGFHEKERLKKGNPFTIISDFNEILPIVEKL